MLAKPYCPSIVLGLVDAHAGGLCSPFVLTSRRTFRTFRDMDFRTVGQVIPWWPSWSPEDEAALQVTEAELSKLLDPAKGNDVRQLSLSSPCSCILHSYATFDMSCPCGCHNAPF